MFISGFWNAMSSSSMKSRMTSRGVRWVSAPTRPNSTLRKLTSWSCVSVRS